MGRVTVRIEDAYSDGHTATHTHVVDAPEQGVELAYWWDNVVWEYTGDGHGKDKDLGYYGEGTIIESDVPGIVGEMWAWDSS